MSKKKDNPSSRYVTVELCDERVKRIEEKISGLKNTIVVGLTIATLVITTILTVVQYFLTMAKP